MNYDNIDICYNTEDRTYVVFNGNTPLGTIWPGVGEGHKLEVTANGLAITANRWNARATSELGSSTFNSINDAVQHLIYKDWERLTSRQHLPGEPWMSANEIVSLAIKTIARTDKIQAIKFYRQIVGVGLKEAKDIVEDIIAPAPMLP